MADVVTSPKPRKRGQLWLICLGFIGATFAATLAFVLMPKPVGMDVQATPVAVLAAPRPSALETRIGEPSAPSATAVAPIAQGPMVTEPSTTADVGKLRPTGVAAQEPTVKHDTVPLLAPSVAAATAATGAPAPQAQTTVLARVDVPVAPVATVEVAAPPIVASAAPQPAAPEAAPITVTARRPQTTPQRVDVDRVGRGNSITIMLPRKG
jgi:hypothetical protein